jgi:hypothetical protein
VLNGVIEELEPPGELLGLSIVPVTDNPFTTVTYDVIRGSRLLAKPNIPNAEAHIVPKQGIGQLKAGYFYCREKKVFEPTTTYWLRREGTLATKRAEEHVTRELQDLVDRVERFKEFCIWRGMFTGSITIDEPDVKANVDYQIDASHRPVLAAGEQWDFTETIAGLLEYTAPIREQINAWKRLTSRDGQAVISDAYANNLTLDVLMRNMAFKGDLISDRQKDALQKENRIPGLWGITWHEYDLGYDATIRTFAPFIEDGIVVFVANQGRPFEMLSGPCADFDAGPDRTGRFSKTWIEPDPSARQGLVEENFFPALYRPDNLVIARVF